MFFILFFLYKFVAKFNLMTKKKTIINKNPLFYQFKYKPKQAIKYLIKKTRQMTGFFCFEIIENINANNFTFLHCIAKQLYKYTK